MSKYENKFYDANDLIEALNRGCEVEFLYKNRRYSITQLTDKSMMIGECYKSGSEKICKDANQVLEFEIEEVKLRDIINNIRIVDRLF